MTLSEMIHTNKKSSRFRPINLIDRIRSIFCVADLEPKAEFGGKGLRISGVKLVLVRKTWCFLYKNTMNEKLNWLGTNHDNVFEKKELEISQA